MMRAFLLALFAREKIPHEQQSLQMHPLTALAVSSSQFVVQHRMAAIAQRHAIGFDKPQGRAKRRVFDMMGVPLFD